jgi:hypothetical protein
MGEGTFAGTRDNDKVGLKAVVRWQPAQRG